MELEELYKRCHELFEVVNGELIRKINVSGCGSSAGAVAGWTCKKGYRCLEVDYVSHKVHRLIYLMTYKRLPVMLDHIDGNRLNNSPNNLRGTTNADNQHNTVKRAGCSSKYKGVGWKKEQAKWHVQGRLNGKVKHIGYFNDEVFAANAADVFNREHHPEFATFNFPKEHERSAI